MGETERLGRSLGYLGVALLWAALSCSPVLALAREAAIPAVGCRAEWDPPTDVLVHTPGHELFLGVVHPEAALYERPFDLEAAAAEHRAYVGRLQDLGARVHELVEALLGGTVDASGEPVEGPALTELRAFAGRFLHFDTTALPAQEHDEQEEYRRQVLSELSPRELVRVILQRPTVRLRPSGGGSARYQATYEVAPVMNLYFLRDPLITTGRGVVLGRMSSEQRRVETEIVRFALARLGIHPIYEVRGEGRLEGGDFLPAGETVFLGQGLRTNAEAVRQLLQNQVFGAARVVVVKDPWRSQEQMHLDTYFNLLGPRRAVLAEGRMDVRDAEGRVLRPAQAERRPRADVYELGPRGYERVLVDSDFQDLLEEKLGYELIAVPAEDQRHYGVNFLTVGPNRILGVAGASPEYRAALQGVEVTWLDLHNLTGGYGAAHCTVQVLHRAPPTPSPITPDSSQGLGAAMMAPVSGP